MSKERKEENLLAKLVCIWYIYNDLSIQTIMKNILLIFVFISSIVGFSYAWTIKQNLPQQLSNSSTTFSNKEIRKYFNIRKKNEIFNFKNRFALNQLILTKKDFIVSWNKTNLSDTVRWNQYSVELFLLHSYHYNNISFIFGRHNEFQIWTWKDNSRSLINIASSWWVDLITADTGHTAPWISIILVKVYNYSWSDLSWAMNYISHILNLQKNCVVWADRPQEVRSDKYPNYFTFQPSEKRFEMMQNKSMDEFANMANKVQCYKGWEHYKYLRYPQLQKIFAILSYGKDGGGWSRWQFQFIGIRNSSWSIEISPYL